MLLSTVITDAAFPGVTTIFVIAVLSLTVCVPFVIVVGATGVTTAAGIELALLGSEPCVFSARSVYPSPSSSGSVISGSPSPSVSLKTVISTILVIDEPSEFVTTIGISYLRFSSLLPQLVTLGVPVIERVPGLYVTPGGSFALSTYSVESISIVPIVISLIACLSTTVCTGLIIFNGSAGVIVPAGIE